MHQFKVPIPFNNFSDPSNLPPLVKNLCMSAAPRSHSELPEVSSFFSKETSLSITLIPAKILHHVTFGAMAIIATRSFITYVQNNGNDSQENIITYTWNNGNNSRKISSCTYRTMGMIVAKFHHVHLEQWEQQSQIFIMCRVKWGFNEIREPVARAEGAPEFW